MFGRYRDDGHTKGQPEFPPPNPIKLQWEISKDVRFLDLFSGLYNKLIDSVEMAASLMLYHCISSLVKVAVIKHSSSFSAILYGLK